MGSPQAAHGGAYNLGSMATVNEVYTFYILIANSRKHNNYCYICGTNSAVAIMYNIAYQCIKPSHSLSLVFH